MFQYKLDTQVLPKQVPKYTQGFQKLPYPYSSEENRITQADLPQSLEVGLAKYFPKGTNFFYAFPAGDSSQFFNQVPAWVEELVSARPLVCSGKDIRVITFHNVLEQNNYDLLNRFCNGRLTPREQIVSLPASISSRVTGIQRNQLVIESLLGMVGKGELIMAQPFLDPRLSDRYQIPAELTVWLNDKDNLVSYIPSEYLPERFFTFANGKAFSESNEQTKLPCVVKVSSSSSGDGVRICFSEADWQKAKSDFRFVSGTVFTDAFITAKKNLCVVFGIPVDKSKSIDILGWNSQVVTKNGGFLGGMVNKDALSKQIEDVLINQVLPRIRRMGWYGVGGIDVLITEDNKFYFIDPNFRMTATLAYILQYRNKHIRKSLISLTGQFKGSIQEFQTKVSPLIKDNLFSLLALTVNNQACNFNGALLFDYPHAISGIAARFTAAGLESQSLSVLGRDELVI